MLLGRLWRWLFKLVGFRHTDVIGALVVLAGASVAAAQTFTVITTSDDGPGSLRYALAQALAGTGGTIEFNVPATDPNFNLPGTPDGWRISLQSALPALGRTIRINGLTQPGASCSSPRIELRPAQSLGVSTALSITANNCEVRGLCINGFQGDGIAIAGVSGAVVSCNVIGATIQGLPTIGNGRGVAIVTGVNNTIGGTGGVATGNLIAGNRGAGVAVTTMGVPSNVGNFILGNAIRDNDGLGIDLADNGVTANDDLDLDLGPNHFQNHPIIQSYDGAQIQFSLASLPNRRFRVEFFASATADPSGFGEGAQFITSVEVASSSGGLVSAGVPYVAPAGVRFLSATATALPPLRGGDPTGTSRTDFEDRGVAPPPPTGTSEFSPAFQITGGSNVPPTAIDDAYSTPEDTTLIVSAPAASVLANDTDPDPGVLTAELVTPVTRGNVLLSPDGTLSYVPNPNFNGIDTFTYRAVDAQGARSSPATVRITVQPVNDAPFAIDDDYEVDEDTTLTIAAASEGVLANDVDAERDPLLATLVTGPSNGALTLSMDGTFIYTPAPNFAGADSFTYRASDSRLSSGVATVTITVRGVNDPPVARDDSYSTNEDTPLTVALPAAGVLGNDSDPDLPPPNLTAMLVSTTTRGSLTFSPNGTFNYSPQPNFNGTDSFTYRASDGQANSNIATVTITVRAVNDTPVARNDSFFTNEDTALTVPPPGVLDNDGDVDDPREALNLTVVTAPSSGQLANVSGGGFRYTPNPDFIGTDSFGYRLTDPSGAMSGVATVTIQVLALNDPPTARPDSFAMDEDTTLTIPAPGVLGNDSDPDVPAQTLRAILLSPPDPSVAFSFLLSDDGSFTLSPVADFTGTISFTYAASDGLLSSAPALVTITVRPINDPPVALNDAYDADQNTPLTITAALGVLQNDFDIDVPAPTLIARRLTGPNNGTLTLNADGSFVYTPQTDFTGADSFTYEAFDGQESSNPATVAINVHGSGNQPPVARCRNITLDGRTTCPRAFTITPRDVDNGSSDPDDATDTLVFAVTPSGPFPPGDTDVTLRVTDPDGLFSTCVARVTVLITDCNNNRIPDACEIADGTARDCNRDGIPDDCQCLWDNGMAVSSAGSPSSFDGRMSQTGGRAQVVRRTIDDFYLEPAQIHQLTSFSGQLLTSAPLAALRVKVEFFEDCDGSPDGRAFASFDNGTLVSANPAAGGFTLATYSFDLCDQDLWLEGGRSYWVSLHAALPCSERGEVLWAMADRGIMGATPQSARGQPSPFNCTDVDFDPWLPIETCCGQLTSCRNMAFKLGGVSCPLIWDNGEHEHCPGGGGIPSGRDGQQVTRAADNFVIGPCDAVTLCMVEAVIWTNGDPRTGFIEIYDNDCRQPDQRLFSAEATRAIPLGDSLAFGPFNLQSYKLQLVQPGWVLQPGRTYWLSAGLSNIGGSINARSLFAVVERCGTDCDTRISPAWMATVGTRGELGWCPKAEDLAFRLFAAAKPAATPTRLTTTAACPADIDHSGDLGPGDLFHFLSAWFAGCP